MAEFESVLNKVLDTFFHLPTLIVLMFLAIGIFWWFYDVGLDFGDGFMRVNSSLGNINLYWVKGCCELDW